MLGSLLTDIQDREHHCTVYRSGEPPEIERWLASHGVDVKARSLPPRGPPPFIEIKVDGEVVGVIGIETVEGLIEPPIVRPDERDGISEGYRVLFEILDQTLISGMNRRELLAVSREIEDRAYRVGAGTLHVSFQALSKFRPQTDVYRTLVTETDLEIHIFGREDWTPPAITGITFHSEGAERFGAYWALAYDGGPDSTQICGLVAEELSDGFTGFWTSDSAIVAEIAARLNTV